MKSAEKLSKPKFHFLKKSLFIKAFKMNSNNAANFGECHPQKELWRVYILLCSDRTHYTGCTSNIDERLERHSKGQVEYTKSRLPVKLLFYAAFADKYKAYNFEKYLKSGSGRAFTLKHLL